MSWLKRLFADKNVPIIVNAAMRSYHSGEAEILYGVKSSLIRKTYSLYSIDLSRVDDMASAGSGIINHPEQGEMLLKLNHISENALEVFATKLPSKVESILEVAKLSIEHDGGEIIMSNVEQSVISQFALIHGIDDNFTGFNAIHVHGKVNHPELGTINISLYQSRGIVAGDCAVSASLTD